MSSWVISSNPETYNAEEAIKVNDKLIDWVTLNNYEIGDTIYIYEVIPPRGRGGIIYKATVKQTDIPFDKKLDDRTFWTSQVYPKNLASSRFSRLHIDSEKLGEGLLLKSLKEHGFTAPQGKAYLLDNNPQLLEYIESQFSS